MLGLDLCKKQSHMQKSAAVPEDYELHQDLEQTNNSSLPKEVENQILNEEICYQICTLNGNS